MDHWKESLLPRKTFCRIIRPYQAGPWGIAQQAIAAVENALVDLKARSLGVPVYELLGGAVREELPLYWSHCGSYRLPRTAEMLGVPPLTSLDDLVSLGKE